MSYTPVEPELRWLGSRRFWTVVVTLVVVAGIWVGWKSVAVASRRASPAQAVLYGQDELTPGLPAAFRVMVRDSRQGNPIPNARVEVVLVSEQGQRTQLGTGLSDSDGWVTAETTLPEDLREGSYRVEVRASSRAGRTSVERAATVRRSFRTLVTTDKPIYQPGQVIHIRALTLSKADLRPANDLPVTLEVQDAKGNKVFKRIGATSEFGVVAADFQLADQVSTGDYQITASIGDTTSSKSVTVSRYVLPKFRLDLTTDRGYYQPGDTLEADLVAEYTFGKPVENATVRVVASEMVETLQPFAEASGRTDRDGRFKVRLPLKRAFVGQELTRGDAFVTVEATVTDPAGSTQTTTAQLTVSTRPIRIAVLPESGELVPGVENVLYLVTAYPDGRPAQTTVRLGPPVEAEVDTSDLGVAQVSFTPTTPGLRALVEATDRRGLRSSDLVEMRGDARPDGFLLRPDRAVYTVGDSATLEVLSAAPTARVFLDVVRNRRTLWMTAFDVVDGRGRVDLDLSDDLAGTLELHAYRVLSDGTLVRDTRVVQVNRAEQLEVQLALDRDTYRPAESAVLDVLVLGPGGSPVQAALGLAGVDEAVFALSDMKPGLELVYFTLQAELLKPRYEIHAAMPAGPSQVTGPSAQAAPPSEQQARQVLFSAAEGIGAPQSQADLGFAEKQQQLQQEKRQYFRGLTRGAVRLPLWLYLLLLVPAPVYALVRLARRRPVDGHADDLDELRRATGGVMWRWWLAFYLPFLLAAAAAAAADLGHAGRPQSAALTAAALGATGAFLLLLIAARRVRRCVAAAAVPALGKVVACLPWAYSAAVAVVVTAVAAAEKGMIGSDDALARLLTVIAIAALTLGFLSAARNTALRTTSVPRWLYLVVTRPVIFLLPALPFLVAAAPGMRGALQRMPLGMEVDDRDFREFKQIPPMPMAAQVWAIDGAKLQEAEKKDESSASSSGEALKAPTRVRSFFPETLFWRPEVVTDDAGRARLEIPLADSITTWRVAASAVSRNGELGSATRGLRVFQDFFVDVDFPVALTQHDEVSVPVAVYNYLDRPQTVRLEVSSGDWCELLDGTERTLTMGSHEVTGVSFRVRAERPGRHALTVKASGSEMADAVRREVTVTPDGQPVIQAFNGRLGEHLTQEVVIPPDAIDGASDLYVKVYPGAFSQVVEGLDSIFQMPFGCFEQTSSTTYPNVLVLDYLRRTRQARPDLELKALSYINLGYQRLLTYEVPGGGFEWFGRPPAHTVLTAYGLLEFSDMAKVSEVDPAVIDRTRTWLYAQQQGDGSWEPTAGGIAEGAINRFQGASFRTTAYIAWALAASGDRDPRLERALGFLESGWSQAGEDPYTLGLVAAAFAAADRDGDARSVLDRLDGLKVTEGETVHWQSSSEGVTYGGGDALAVETTAVIAQAMLASGAHTQTAHKALAWLVEHKDPRGTWFSTQATVQAMRALLAGTGAGGGVEGTVNVTVAVNGEVAQELEITPETADVFRLVDLRPFLKEGANTVALEASGRGNLAYQVVATHHIPWEGTGEPEDKPLAIEVAYDRTLLEADDLLGCEVKVRYNRPGAAMMTIVDLGVPPGFEVLTEAFDRLKSDGVIQRYSLTGRQVILYFDRIDGGVPVVFRYQLRAKFPVRAQAPGATAYQYYEPEVRDETRPVEITVS